MRDPQATRILLRGIRGDRETSTSTFTTILSDCSLGDLWSFDTWDGHGDNEAADSCTRSIKGNVTTKWRLGWAAIHYLHYKEAFEMGFVGYPMVV
jgi:hypothetical protein